MEQLIESLGIEGTGKVDPALLRPGRVDLRITVNPLGHDAVVRYAQHAYPDAGFNHGHVPTDLVPVPGSVLHGLLVQYPHDPGAFMHAVQTELPRVEKAISA